MKKIYNNLIALLVLLVSSFTAQAQCPYDNSLYVSLSAPTTVGASIGTEDCIFPGEYYRVTGMQAGSTYRISTCNTTDVADTRVTVYAAGGAGGALTFNDDFCGLLSRVDFTPTSTGSYDILVDMTGPGGTCDSDENCVEMTITLIGTSGSSAYCVPTYSIGTANGDYINGVALGSINNQNTGSENGPAYTDYTNLSTTLDANTEYTVAVSNNPDFSEIVAAWIDYNQDFEFSEDELLGQASVGANQTANLTFTTPASPLPGNTRMRVRMVFSVPQSGATVDPCANSSLGETEDYTINFSSNNPPIGPGALSFSTNCGAGIAIQDNACPNNTLATVEVGGLSALGTGHILSSVEVIIPHTMAADLDLYLEAPDGSVVELSTDNGGNGADYGIYEVDNCNQTALFSMSASTPVSGSSAPFVGSYIPEGDLNDFNAGTIPNGLWRLRACDDFAGDVGTIQFVRLNFSINATEIPDCVENLNVSDGATNVSLDQTFSWTAGAGNPSGYDVYFGTDSGNLTLVADGQAGTSYDPGALTANTTYYIQIVPVNNVGPAEDCPVISFTTVDEGSTEVIIGNGQVTVCDGVFYDSGGPNNNYADNEVFIFTIFPATPNSAIQLDFTSFLTEDLDIFAIADGVDEFAPVIGVYGGNIAPETVTATNPDGALTIFFVSDESINFDGWSANISCVPFGAIPECVASASPADGSTDVAIDAIISWTAGGGDPTSYDVYFGTSDTPGLAQAGVTETSFSPGVLLNNTTYYYQIVPVNGSGSAENCPVYSFTTAEEASNVVLMGDGTEIICDGFFYDSGNADGDYSNDEDYTLTITPETANSALEVSFTSFTSEEGFDVLTVYSGIGTGGQVLGTLTGSISETQTFTSLAVDGSLTFTFTSDFQVPQAGWAATLACVPPLTAPDCATNLAPADGSTDQLTDVTLSWEAGAGDPTAYDVYFGDDEQALVLVSEGQTELSYAANGLNSGTTYYWQVVPSNIVGSATDCPVSSFTTAEALEAPECATLVSPADGATDVAVMGSSASWTAGGGGAPDSYDLYFGTDALNLALVAEGTTETSFALPDLAYATEYFWSVIPSNAAGAPADCPVFSFTTEDEPVSDIIVMQEGAVSACSGTFTDDGGLDNNYANDGNFTLVITPDQPGNVLQVTFASFDTEEDFDFLTIYDGNSTAAPLIGEFTGVDIVPGVVTSTAVDGSLTFVFTSDASVNRAGWEATVACIDPNAAPECATAYSPADASVEVSNNPVLSWQNGGGLVTGYDVYFGTDPDNLALVSEGQAESTFATGELDLATTYYWQIVPVGTGGSAEGCPVNSFTTVETLPILMQNGEVTTCSANFYDSGGPDGNYSVDESSVLTIFPEVSGNLIQVDFTSFDIEEGWEFLTVYDGPDVNSPVIGVFSGDVNGGDIPTTPITSSSVDGSLTFEFTSDASFVFTGWEATVTCIDPNEAPGCAQNFVPADGATDVSVAALVLSWEQGTGLATGYDVYFGTDPDNLVLVSPNQSETSFNPGQLDLNSTYYWQVIPLNENASAENCVINSFTTSSIADIIMTNGTVTTCDANFYDSGNIDGNYSLDENYTLTIFPSEPGNLVQVDFTFFDIEEDWEFLTVFDGPDINAPQIGIFSGNVDGGFIPTQPITSTSSDGSLTFVFTSDASFTFAGWEATVSCVDAAALPECAVNYSPADGSTDISASNASLTWSSGASVVTSYDVYFGTDPDNLVLVSPEQLEANFNPGQLELNTTYYWQIISNNDNGSSADCPVLSFTTSSSTDILQQEGTQTTCDANYYDSGGADGNYSLTETSVLTIFPDQPGNSVQVNFSEFDVENGWDFLNIYDGPDNTAPLIGAFTGNLGLGTGTTPAGPITSTSPDGSLTFEFTSDVSVTTAGWVASIVCVSSEELPGCAINLSPADASIDQSIVTNLSWGAGTGVTLAYDVYFGTDPDNLVLVSEGQAGTSFNPGALEVSTTYYWQIVPQNGAGSADGCAVNSFTTEDQATLNIFNGEITICDATLFDSGGPDNDYQIDEDYTLTIYPSTPGSFVQIDFVSYDSESGFDFLDIYNGNAATGTPAVSLTGGPQVPAQFISSAADGSLTFNFVSDGSVTRSGFEILISCFVPTEAPSCSDNYFPADASIDVPLNADLSWTGVGFPTSFNVLFGTDPDNLVEVASGITSSTFDPAPLAANTTYYWQIVPSNDFGSAVDCPVLSFTTSGSTEIIMNNGTETTCLANFFDSGGPDASYSVDENFTLTVFPDQVDNVIQVVFNSFNVEATWDALYIFNGPDVNSPLIASPNGPTNGGSPAGGWWGTSVIGPFTSTDPSGALTFQFISDGSVTTAGWDALIQCVSTTEVPGCVTNAAPVDASLDVSPTNTVLSWTPGDGLTITYDVYFGTDPDNLVLVSPGQTETTFNPGQLDLSTTYYWQIVPSNDAGAAEGCPVLSFTTSGSIDIIMSTTTVTTCDANFYDSGGEAGTYVSNENNTLTIFPDQPGNAIQVTFTAFNVEPTWDALYIFNGPDVNAPLINSGNGPTNGGNPAGGWWGTDVIIGPFTSSDPTGALTFQFISDGSVTRPGWTASVICIDATEPPTCVNISTGPADGATDICVNEAVLGWTMGAGAPANTYDVYFDFGGGLVLVSDDQTETTFDPGVLEPNTTYSYQIVPANANGEAVDCPVITFTTGECLNYCDAGATICDEYIADVQMGNINNPTDCTAGGYNDYTDQSTDVYIGTGSLITVSNGSLQWPTDVLGIWVDWNQDGDFEDVDETIVVTGSPGTGPYTALITPPVDAVVGSTTMRIRVQFGGTLDPCGITTFGEVEDYTLIVNEPLACPFPNNIMTSETTTTSTVITWDAVTDVLEYQIRYRLESEDESVSTWANPLVVPAPLTFTFLENLEVCENYVLQIGSVCEVGEEVIFSSNVFFATRCIDCTDDFTAEGEDCGTDLNGGCNSGTFGAINCGETICGTSFMDGSTRDTDWFNFDVTESGVFQVEILAEFNGTVFFADATDCNNIVILSQANFNAGDEFTLATSLNPGTVTVILVPVFEQPVFDCLGFNGYTLTLSSGTTQIAPVGDICTSTPAFNMFAIPEGGTWSGNGITDSSNGTFDPSTVGVGSYVITYTPDGAGCASADSLTITVSEAPEADFVGLAATYCPSADDVVLTGIPAGGTFSISPTVPGAIAGNVFIPSICPAGAYEITYVVAIEGSSCAGSITQSVDVLDSPIASIDNLPTTICSQDAEITLTATPAGGVFSGSGIEGDVFNPMMASLGMVTITYSADVEGFDCPAVATADIQVNPSPVVSINGISGDYCLNSDPVVMQGIPALGTFLIDGVEAANATFDPAAAGIGAHIIRYEFDNGTCVGYSEITINVVENLTIDFAGTPTEVCSEDDPFIITTNPSGATFSGLGVFGSTFSPKVAGAGDHVITATYTNGNCTVTATHTITVNPSPVAAFSYNVNGATVSFNNASQNATTYSWDFGDQSTSTSVNPTHTYSANGSYTITLTASNPECGESVFSAQLELSVGIGSIEGVDMIQLYPNPTRGMITLAFNSLNNQSFEVRITDATGRLIEVDAMDNYIGKFNKQYDLSDKAKGVYFFTVTSEKGSMNFRVVRD